MEASFRERLKYEIIGILLVALAFFLFLSLISYSPADPSFNAYTTRKVDNWMGRAGAYTSESLFWSFGFPAFLIPLFLGIFAFGFIFRWEWKYLPLKCAGWVVILLAASSLFGLWMKSLPVYNESFQPGGVIGFIFSKGLVRYFNLPGATILLTVVLIVSFVLGTGISFIALVQRLGEGATGLVERIRTLRTVRGEQAKRARKLVQQEKETGEAEAVTPPVVVVEKPAAPKPKEAMKQESFEFMETSKVFQLPPITLLDADVEKRQKIEIGRAHV